jgi:hypothetical protein
VHGNKLTRIVLNDRFCECLVPVANSSIMRNHTHSRSIARDSNDKV